MHLDTDTNLQETQLDFASRGSNQSGMRAYNERLVLSLVRQSGGMAKAEIARKTGLSAQTVSVIMRSLEADGLLERGEPLRGKRGQPSVPFHLARDGAFFLGLKIGRRTLDLVLTDFLGEVRHRMHARHRHPTPDGVVAFALDAIGQLVGRLPPAHQARVAGLGIALPFQLWAWADALGADASGMDEWQRRDIAKDLGAVCDFPVFVCNDASAACGAELVFGSPDKPRDFLYFYVGFFIGGGLVLNGALYTGSSGNAAALGSMFVPDADNRLRQLVEVASLASLEKALGPEAQTEMMAWDAPQDWTPPQDLLDAWLDEAAAGIGHAILASVSLIDVDHILIDGWMPSHMRAELARRIRAQIEQFPAPGIQTPQVLEGSIGPDARAIGAASLPLSKRFLIESTSFLKGAVS